MIMGIAVDCEGRPLCCEMRPENTTDAETFPVVVGDARGVPGPRTLCGGRLRDSMECVRVCAEGFQRRSDKLCENQAKHVKNYESFLEMVSKGNRGECGTGAL